MKEKLVVPLASGITVLLYEDGPVPRVVSRRPFRAHGDDGIEAR
jgi:hypothetical protein